MEIGTETKWYFAEGFFPCCRPLRHELDAIGGRRVRWRDESGESGSGCRINL